MWLWILLGLAILVILFYRPRENMTNDQLIGTLKTFGEQGSTPSTSKTSGPSTKEIYGPGGVPPPVPTNTGAGGGKTVGGPYPHIFGPDTKNAPGTTSGSVNSGNPVPPGQVASDKAVSTGSQGPADQFHEFNPELAKAFPVDGPPQPFLTDFSKIQH
jgi:hypothetical protein